MLASGESQKEVIRPDFNRAIMMDFQGTRITSDVGFLLIREINDLNLQVCGIPRDKEGEGLC